MRNPYNKYNTGRSWSQIQQDFYAKYEIYRKEENLSVFGFFLLSALANISPLFLFIVIYEVYRAF